MLLRTTFWAGPLRRNNTNVHHQVLVEAVFNAPDGPAPRSYGIAKRFVLDAQPNAHTRSHLDHLCFAREVKEAFDGDIGLHKDDLFLYIGTTAQMLPTTIGDAL